MDKGEEKALNDIDQHGCHILHVMEEDDHPGFSYSIGIEKSTGQPEVVVTGLKRELAHWMINEYNNRVKAGEVFEPNSNYSGFLEEFDITFKGVETKHYPEYFGWGVWLYKGDNFKVFQLVYPSTSGVWPWEEDAPEVFTWFMPRLYAN